MKQLESVMVDGHTVEIEAHREKGGIRFIATSGNIRRERFMTMDVHSPSTPEQHAINVKKDCEALAREVVHHKGNEGFLDDFFEE